MVHLLLHLILLLWLRCLRDQWTQFLLMRSESDAVLWSLPIILSTVSHLILICNLIRSFIRYRRNKQEVEEQENLIHELQVLQLDPFLSLDQEWKVELQSINPSSCRSLSSLHCPLKETGTKNPRIRDPQRCLIANAWTWCLTWTRASIIRRNTESIKTLVITTKPQGMVNLISVNNVIGKARLLHCNCHDYSEGAALVYLCCNTSNAVLPLVWAIKTLLRKRVH